MTDVTTQRDDPRTLEIEEPEPINHEDTNPVVRLSGMAAALIILAIAAAMIYEILLRWVTGSGTTWVYEATGISLLWFTMLAGGFVLSQKKHIAVDLISDKLTSKTRSILNVASSILTLAYVAVLFYFIFVRFLGAFISGQRTPTPAQIPLALILGVVAFGLAVFALQAILSLRNDIRTFKESSGPTNLAALIFFSAAVIAAFIIWPHLPQVAVVVLLFTLLFAGLPVFLVLGVVGLTGLLFLYEGERAFTAGAYIAYSAVDSHTLLAIPLFILAGIVLQRGGIGADLYNVAATWIGGIRGGLGLATMLACAIFASISGSSVATAGAIGLIALPQMLKRGYRPKNSYGMVAAGGTLGILIPPSTAMIVYAGVTNESTGQLFVGGVLPGIVLLTIFCIFIYFTTDKKETVNVQYTFRERRQALAKGGPGLLMPVIVLLGIYLGLFTATEAAAVALVYSVILTLLQGRLKLSDMPEVLRAGTLSSGMITMIVVGAHLLGDLITLHRIPNALIAFVDENNFPTIAVMIGIVVAYLVLGMFLEVIAVLLITLPIVYPLIISMGIDGLWFGIFIVILMELALITPPVGLNLFVIKDITGAKLSTVLSGTAPYFLLLLLGAIIVAIFPSLVTWLPSQIYGP